MVRVVKRAGGIQSQLGKAEEDTHSSTIIAYSSGQGKHATDRVLRLFTPLEILRHHVSSSPLWLGGESLVAHLNCAPDVPKMACNSVSLAAGSQSIAPKLLSTLDAYWSAQHRPVYEEDWQGPPTNSEREFSRCFEAGHCIIHCVEGRRLYRFHNNLLRTLKLYFPRKTPGQQDIREGWIVVRLRGGLGRATLVAVDGTSLLKAPKTSGSSGMRRGCC